MITPVSTVAAVCVLAGPCASVVHADPVVVHHPFDSPEAGHGKVVAQVAIDADFEFFMLNGADVEQTLAAIEGVIGPVGGIFEEGPGVAFEVTAVVIRTTPADPYSATDANLLFAEVRAEWLHNQPDVEWDTVQLMTGKNLNGALLGFAGLSSICTDDAISIVAGAGLALEDRVQLSAHQLGHVFGAPHCEGADCGVMCAAVGGCGGDPLAFGRASIAAILELIGAQGACLDGACAADCNADGALNVLDFVCFQGLFQGGEGAADCNGDGVLDVLDFVCFQGAFTSGCE